MSCTFSRFETLPQKFFVGKNSIFSLADNKTVELWRSFMPYRNEIKNRLGSEFYSIEIYPPSYFNAFSPKTTFEKWAAVEVQNLDEIPDGMKSLNVPEGKYAVFIYKGESSKAAAAFEYIFTKWFPQSGFRVDERPHFAVMGEKYKNDSVESEEEIWVPVREREIRN